MAEVADHPNSTRLSRRFWVVFVLSLSALLLSLVAMIFALIESRKSPQTAPATGNLTSCDGSAVAKATMSSVVTLFVKSGGGGGNGSGEFLDTDGHILTNNHVISAPSRSCDPTARNFLPHWSVATRRPILQW